MKKFKYKIEITFPDDDTNALDEDLLTNIIVDSPELERCLVKVNLEEEPENKFGDKLERLLYLARENKIILVNCDKGEIILAEMWKEGKTIRIFPFAKYLSQEEIGELKLEGDTPENADK